MRLGRYETEWRFTGGWRSLLLGWYVGLRFVTVWLGWWTLTVRRWR